MTISSNDSYINPADVTSEADEIRCDIEMKEEEIEETQEEINDLEVEIEDAEEEDVTDLEDKLQDLRLALANQNCELDEIKSDGESILELDSDCEDYARGESLINESIFAEYVEELAVDCGDVSRDSWIYSYIDWEKAADDATMDYTTIEFEGQSFYVRS